MLMRSSSSTISARGAPVHGGAAPWRSSCAASARRDDAHYCASPNASRTAPSRHQPAAPDAASVLAFQQQQTVQQQASERHVAISHVLPKNTTKLPNFQHTSQHGYAIFYDIFSLDFMLTRSTVSLGACLHADALVVDHQRSRRA